jgi:hypothetical protein
MPLIKKLIKIHGSKAIVIPSSYFEYYLAKGKKIDKVSLELNGEKIIITPILNDLNECEQDV